MKAKKIIIKSKKDDTEMTQEAFFDKIDKASKQKGKPITAKEFEAKYL